MLSDILTDIIRESVRHYCFYKYLTIVIYLEIHPAYLCKQFQLPQVCIIVVVMKKP